jgi:cytochrome oxidase Cu insertion factor (SCO1/SenC/PrrC family)
MKQRKTFTLWLITFIFGIPLLAAWFAYSNGFFLSGKTTNHGTLLIPPINIQTMTLRDRDNQLVAQQLRGKWWLVYLTTEPLDAASQHNLYYMRQIRQATGKNRDRVARAIVTIKQSSDAYQQLFKQFPGMAFFIISPEKIADLEIATKKLALAKGSLYLVDPLGNIMMSYALDAPPKGILKDLERLLKVSQIG